MELFTFDESDDTNDTDDSDNLPSQASEVVRMSRRDLINSRARLRSQINRDNDASHRRSVDMAKKLIEYAAHSNSEQRKDQDKVPAITYAISNLALGVINSLGIMPRLRIDPEYMSKDLLFSACTDMKDIRIGVNQTSSLYNLNDPAFVADMVKTVKGLVYHEGGHLLWTTPFETLIRLSGVEVAGNNSIFSGLEYLRKYAPYAFTDPADPLNAMYNLTTMQTGISIEKLRIAWNILEDQRMETAMCSTSPIMARYLTVIVENIVIKNVAENMPWPWIIGRTYLPKDLRQRVRNNADSHPSARILPDMEDLVMRYRRSNDPTEMLNCVIGFYECLMLWTASVGQMLSHVKSGADKHESTEDSEGRQLIPVPDPGSFDIEQPNVSPSNDSGDDNNSEDDRDPNKGGASTESDTAAKPQPSNESTENKNKHDRDTESFMSAITEYLSSPMKPPGRMNPMTSDQMLNTDKVMNGMLGVLDSLVDHTDPSWTHYLENGVLDPVAYELSQPGDTSFWSGLDNTGAVGYDLSVSLVIDVSGSMESVMDQVSTATVGIKKACERLKIPCTVTAFSDSVYLISEGEDEIDYVQLQAVAGTSIFDALQGLASQRFDKKRHLVVILTDGEWVDVKDLRMWSDAGRFFLLLGYGMYNDKAIANKGADQCVLINNVLDMPTLITRQLMSYLV